MTLVWGSTLHFLFSNMHVLLLELVDFEYNTLLVIHFAPAYMCQIKNSSIVTMRYGRVVCIWK